MLAIHARALNQPGTPIISNAEFFRIELSALATGRILVSLTATTVDPGEPQLLDQELACDPVQSIDELIELIRTHVQIARL